MGEDMSLYKCFKAEAVLHEKTDYVKVYRLLANGKEYRVVITKKRANRHTIIHCKNNHVAWEQVPRYPRFAGRNYGDRIPICVAKPEKGRVTLIVVQGKPNAFVGLDEGVFHCADNLDETAVNVMSYQRFKKL